MTVKRSPFKADVVGSFLRPEELKLARKDYQEGKISKEDLTKVEDKLITELIKKQKAAGLQAFTDGEFRRSWWHLDFFWGLGGVEKIQIKSGYQFAGQETRAESAAIIGKITGENHPFIEHFKFIKQFEDENTVPRQTIPAPSQFLSEIYRDSGEVSYEIVYPNKNDLLEDISNAYAEVIQDLYDAGLRNLQLDDCTWGRLVDTKTQRQIIESGRTPEEVAQEYLDLNNSVIAKAPEDLTITTHVCRGNYHSAHFGTGGYESISKFLFRNENVKAFYLEYDSDRAGGFEPLKDVSGDKEVVLGLITSKFPELEDKDLIISRINEAAKYLPLERLALSPQCGFASTEEGNVLTEEDQWAKIKLVVDIAKEVWG